MFQLTKQSILIFTLFFALKSFGFSPLDSKFECKFPEQDSISLQDIELFLANNKRLYRIGQNWDEKSKIIKYSIRVIRNDSILVNHTNSSNTISTKFKQTLLNVEVEDRIQIYKIKAKKDNFTKILLPEINKIVVPKKEGYQLKRICPFRESVDFKGRPKQVVESKIDPLEGQRITRQIEFDNLGRIIFFKGSSLPSISYELVRTLKIDYSTNALTVGKDLFQFKNQERMISFIATLGYGSIVSSELDTLFFNSTCKTKFRIEFDHLGYSMKFCYENGFIRELFLRWYPPAYWKYNFEYGKTGSLTQTSIIREFGTTGEPPPAEDIFYNYEFDSIGNWIVCRNSKDPSKIVRKITYYE